MENKQALKKLKEAYLLYEETLQNSSIACKKGCKTCCTVNVSLTTLEAASIMNNTEAAEIITSPEMKKALDAVTTKKRYIPKVTMNAYAQLCLDRKTPPEEENDPLWGVCPFLMNSVCSIYSVRPFACRCMVSYVPCNETGYADIDEWLLVLNQAFIQYIEHIDSGGYTANLSDLLGTVGIQAYRKKSDGQSSVGNGLKNRRVPMMMVPPEYHHRVGSILKKLNWD